MSTRFVGATIITLFLALGAAGCALHSNLLESAEGKPDPNGDVQETPLPTLAAVRIPDLGRAPEFNNEVWLNVDQPQSLASLRGKAVLIEFWTYG